MLSLLMTLIHLLASSSSSFGQAQIPAQSSARAQQYWRRSLARQVLVPGSPIRPQDRPVKLIVPPSESYVPNEGEDLRRSYVIEDKRFVEAVSNRCMASTILDDPLEVEPSFVLIKPQSEIRLNATAPKELILGAGFEPDKRSFIIVHGFTQSYPSTGWLRKTRALFEMHTLLPRYNLIIMDWGKASQESYSGAAAKVSGMGSFLANFIGKLLELGADRMSIHLIGHSLGAHVASFAGKRIRPRLGRITALDPAGPCFGKIISNNPTDRLAPDDAYQVVVYHYDDAFLGLSGQHGQLDVYVNGGSQQPGCADNMNSMIQALITMVFRRNRVLSQSHTRSTEVATSQLSTSNCQQVAYECRDYASFMRGECANCDQHNNQCFLMGFEFQYLELPQQPLRSSFPGKRLYIATGANEPFCSHHYQLLLRLEPLGPQQLALMSAEKRNANNKWTFQLTLINDKLESLNVTIGNQMAPTVYSHLLLVEARPMRVVAAKLQVRSADNKSAASWPLPFRLSALEVNFMSHIEPQVRRSLSSCLCASQAELEAQSNLVEPNDLWLNLLECSRCQSR